MELRFLDLSQYPRWFAGFLVLCLALVDTSRLSASLITNLPAGDTAIRDNSATFNFGTDAQMPIGVSKAGTVHNRGLIKFDLGSVPPNATITAVTLRLTVVQNGTLDSSYDVNRLLVNWSETNATWNSRLASVPWNTPGAQATTEYILNPSAQGILQGTGLSTDFSSAGLVSDVQNWVNNPGTNFGWIVIATGDAPATGKIIGSREDPDNSPLLIIQYTAAAPPPAAPVITNTALVGNQFQFSFNAESNRTYAVQFNASLLNTNWTVLSNIPAQPTSASILITDPLTSSNRFYRIRTP